MASDHTGNVTLPASPGPVDEEDRPIGAGLPGSKVPDSGDDGTSGSGISDREIKDSIGTTPTAGSSATSHAGEASHRSTSGSEADGVEWKTEHKARGQAQKVETPEAGVPGVPGVPAPAPEAPTETPEGSKVPDALETPQTEPKSQPDPAIEAKAQQIRDACARADFAQLQTLAETEGGFLDDELRQLAWAVLLGVPDVEDGVDGEWKELTPHRDEEQVQLDVNRAFVHYPHYNNAAEEERQKQALSALIVEVLRRHPYLCYFQGFHDICQVFLLVLPPALRTPSVVRLAVLRIRDFMLPTIDAAVQQLLLLPDILHAADPALWAHLRLAQHPRPFFALSGTLTMYAHDVQTLGAIARLFDVLLARPPAFSLYLFAAIACAHRDALFATPADEPEMLHHILSKLPGRAGAAEEEVDDGGDENENEKQNGGNKTPPIDALVASAAKMAQLYPPNSLPSWKLVSAASVLKTAADPVAAATLTLEDGEQLFYEHVRELERAKRRQELRDRARKLLWQYRGPIRAVGIAVLVAVAAVVLRKSGSDRKLAALVSGTLGISSQGSWTSWVSRWVHIR